eukprot:gnl/MRDRNA2_/MRDRNA2_35178_c0_seq1.p1 gnl/MRDRNA2_/MRDRNA2_35178_c0~~gnl/MRDRNA2_/MRDRNA2_35178_c0_seq1.p1  ORF type:complete len:614 (-),score=114.84 gnl/MRDRNA2_/MRDRNA2_35178_c0_seq1:163-2004(-)
MSFPVMVVAAALLAYPGNGCTNILVSKGASLDGSTMISYNADSGSLYGSLGHYPAADHPLGTTREIWDWDGSFYLGSIPEVSHTYNVVGNANEHGLIIGETTFGGLPQLDGHGTGAIMDYGSLIWVTLQRATTAREAIMVMDSLCQKYGYASDGESFSIADGDEVWLMELIGKGKQQGAVWVARRVPEGYIGSTANQARIQTFPLDDPQNCLYAKDVVTFAQDQGLYPKSSKPEDFSFSDTYDPATFSGVRLGEARVWNIFQPASGGAFSEYLDYAQGYNLTNRMPLFAKVVKKLHVNDTMNLMRTHFEGTWFDPTGTTRNDVGAGPGNSAYRWRPLEWESGGKKYVNERTVGVQQTAWAFVAQSRSWLPAPIRALFWFAPDDSSTAVRIPLYGGATKIPPSFGDRVGQEPGAGVKYAVDSDAYTMSMDSAFWVWNLVANMAYGERYADVMPIVQNKIHFYQDQFFAATAQIDTQAEALLRQNATSAEAIALITKFGVDTGEQMTKDWRDFWMYLFVRFRDGFTVSKPVQAQCTGNQRKDCTSRLVPEVSETGYSKKWYARIVADGDNAAHYGVPVEHFESSEARAANQRKIARMDKIRDYAPDMGSRDEILL